MGDRNGRWAMIVEKDGTVSYAENESNPRQVTVSTWESLWIDNAVWLTDLQVSGAEAILGKL